MQRGLLRVCHQSFHIQLPPTLMVAGKPHIHRPLPQAQLYIPVRHEWIFFQQEGNGP